MGDLVVTADAAGEGRPHRCCETCAGLHAYVADGRRVCWRPGTAGRFAVDAERVDQQIPEELARQWTRTATRAGESFWHAWTRAEALAKLSDISILVWLRTAGFGAAVPQGVCVEHLLLDNLLVCCAWRPA